MRKLFYWLVLVAIPVVALVAVGELYGVIFAADKKLYRFDSELGWMSKSNFTYDRMRVDVAGNSDLVRSHGQEFMQQIYQTLREIVTESVQRRNGRLCDR